MAKRREPAQARALILDAAERVFAESLPDQVGLKEIARAAGVSHGLVTHYFRTYEGLVRETLQRRLDGARERALTAFLASDLDGSDFPLIDAQIDMLRDPVTVRLMTWSFLNGDELGGGLRLVVDAVMARLGAMGMKVGRARIERSILLGTAATFGLALIGGPLGRALGRQGEFDLRDFRRDLGAMVRAWLETSRRDP